MHMRAAARAPFTRIPARMVSLAWADALAFIQANPVPVLSSLAAAVVLGLVLLKLSSSSGAASSGAPFLDPTQFKPMRLVDKAFITHNTLRMRFALAHPSQRLGLPIGQHMSFLGQGADGKDVYRSYTPVSDDGQLGAVDFVIKVYPTGKMTQILNKLQVGQTIMVKGPKVGRAWRGGAGRAWACMHGGVHAARSRHAACLHACLPVRRGACSTRPT